MPMVPNNFSGLITFTRASGATFVGSNGLIQLAATNVPRFDYDPVTLAVKGLLIEEQRTNLFTYSEQFDNAAWIKNNATVTANAAVSPDGTTTAESLTATTNTAYVFSDLNHAVTSYQISVYAKADTGNVVWLYVRNGAANGTAYFDLSDLSTQAVAGTFSTPSNLTITSVGSGWYRLSATFNNGVALVTGSGIGVANAKGSVNATSGKSIFIWGAQLEAGAFPTSYIPTVASQVTRSADVASVNTLSPWFNATEGTFVAAYIPNDPAPSNARGLFIADDGTGNNIVGVSVTTNLRGILSLAVGGTGGGPLSANSGTVNQVNTVAGAYKVNDYAVSLNGGAVATSTTLTLPTVTRATIGFLSRTSLYANAHIRRITYYPRKLSSAELQALTV